MEECCTKTMLKFVGYHEEATKNIKLLEESFVEGNQSFVEVKKHNGKINNTPSGGVVFLLCQWDWGKNIFFHEINLHLATILIKRHVFCKLYQWPLFLEQTAIFSSKLRFSTKKRGFSRINSLKIAVIAVIE